jgi:hypothetical protein
MISPGVRSAVAVAAAQAASPAIMLCARGSLTCVAFARPPQVRISTVKQTSQATVSGRAGRAGSPGRLAAARAHPVAPAQQHELRSVFQQLKGLEGDGLRAVLHAPQQVRAGEGEPDPPVHGEEPAAGRPVRRQWTGQGSFSFDSVRPSR